MRNTLIAAFVFVTIAAGAAAQQFDLPEGAVGDAAALTKSMPALAGQLIGAYKDDDRVTCLDNLFRLKIKWFGDSYIEVPVRK